jgi:putative membrane protein
MKNLAKKFLTDSEKKQIRDTVTKAEKTTSGEIVVMVVPASYHYPMADILGAVAFSLPISLVLAMWVGAFLWIGPQNMWFFLGIFCVLFTGFYFAFKQFPRLKRVFISKKEIDEEVQEAALTGFFREGLYKTRDETGVLIFISILEHKVIVLADRGINAKLPANTWKDIVDRIVLGIREQRQTDAICQAVEAIGRLLAQHFPIKADDTDELKSLIIDQ